MTPVYINGYLVTYAAKSQSGEYWVPITQLLYALSGYSTYNPKTNRLEVTPLGNVPYVSSSSPRPLANIGPVAVIVSYDGDKLDDYGLSQSDLQTTAELKIRSSGIEVSTDLHVPTLLVSVSVMKFNDAEVSYHLDCSLVADVILPGKSLAMTNAATWSATGKFGICPIVDVAQISQHVDELVAGFCNDYLKANPKN